MDLDRDHDRDRDRGEVIGDGREDGVSERLTLWLNEWRGRWPDGRLARWLAPRRRRVRRVTAVVGAVAVVATATGVAGHWYLGGPPLPRLTGARSTVDTAGVLDARWEAGTDGRPASKVHLAVQGEVTLRGLPTSASARTELLGIAGPGVDGAFPEPVVVPGEGEPTAVVRGLELACDAVPLPVPASGYGVRVQVTDGGRRSVGVLPAGDLSAWLSLAVTQSCGSWLAKRDAELTGVTATPDPGQPTATLALTVTNRGRHPLRLFPLGGAGFETLLGDAGAEGGANGGPQTLPASATTTVTATLTVSSCTEVLAPLPSPDSSPGTTVERLGLVGTATASDPTQTTDGLHVFGDGIGPTGLLMSPQLTARVDALKATLCGGLGQPDPSVDLPRARWDAARREITLPLRIAVPGGTVSAAILNESTQSPDGADLLTAPGSRFTIGGHGGELSLTLTYRVAYRETGTSVCGQDDHLQLGVVGVNLLVATRSGPRTVPLQFGLTGAFMPSSQSGMCG